MSADTIIKLILSAIIILGFGGVLIVYMMLPTTAAAQSNVAAVLLGALSGGYGTVIHYWFSPKGGD
jgi:hypothetical protein